MLRPVPAEVPSCRYPGSPPSRPASRGEAQQRTALAAGRLLPRPAAPRQQAHPQHHRGTASPGPDPDLIASARPIPPAAPAIGGRSRSRLPAAAVAALGLRRPAGDPYRTAFAAISLTAITKSPPGPPAGPPAPPTAP
jgi:hypothetical protein